MTERDWHERSPLLFISFYIELPFDVGLDVGQAARRLHVANGPLHEWADLDLDALLGMPPFEEKGTFPCTTFYFRRAVLPARSPMDAAMAAYPEHFPQPEARSSARRMLHLIGDLGALVADRVRADLLRMPVSTTDGGESLTVVEAVRVVQHETGIFSSAWLDEQFEIVIASLNEYLLALAAASGDPRIGPITRIELPPLVVGFQADFRDGLPLRMQPLTLWIHSNIPRLERDLPKDVVAHAMEIVGGPREVRPFFSTLELMVASHRSLFSARFRHAVLESGTAMELMIYTAVREVATGEGWTPQKLENVGKVFANLVRHHFAPMLGFSSDLETSDDALGNWWRTGYKLRNDVVHDGHNPTREETIAALSCADALNEALGLSLSKHPHTTERFPHQALQRPPSVGELLKRSDPGTAEALLREDESLDPGVRAFNLGVTLLQQGRDEEAEREFLAAVETSNHPGAALTCGSLCLGRGESETAEGFYRIAVESQNPKYAPFAALALGDLLANKDPDDAEYYYRRAIASDQEDVVPEACFALGSLLETNGRGIDAERVWEQGARLGDGRSAANVGNRKQARGDIEGAEQGFRMAMEDQTVRAMVAVNLGLLLLGTGRDQEASEILEEASNLGNGRAALQLATMRFNRGDTGAAKVQLERAATSPEREVVEAASDLQRAMEREDPAP